MHAGWRLHHLENTMVPVAMNQQADGILRDSTEMYVIAVGSLPRTGAVLQPHDKLSATWC